MLNLLRDPLLGLGTALSQEVPLAQGQDILAQLSFSLLAPAHLSHYLPFFTDKAATLSLLCTLKNPVLRPVAVSIHEIFFVIFVLAHASSFFEFVDVVLEGLHGFFGAVAVFEETVDLKLRECIETHFA